VDFATPPPVFARHALTRPTRIGREVVRELIVRRPTAEELVEFAIAAPRFSRRVKRTGRYPAAIARLAGIPLSTALRLSIGDQRGATAICMKAIEDGWAGVLAGIEEPAS
jgi:hypothetical protein